MWMRGIPATKVEYFTVTVDRRLLIFPTVMSEMSFHQPGLGVVWINFQYAVNEDLGDFPSLFGNSTRCV